MARDLEGWRELFLAEYANEEHTGAVRVLSCITDSWDIVLPTEIVAVCMLEEPTVVAQCGSNWAVNWSRVSTVD